LAVFHGRRTHPAPNGRNAEPQAPCRTGRGIHLEAFRWPNKEPWNQVSSCATGWGFEIELEPGRRRIRKAIPALHAARSGPLGHMRLGESDFLLTRPGWHSEAFCMRFAWGPYASPLGATFIVVREIEATGITVRSQYKKILSNKDRRSILCLKILAGFGARIIGPSPKVRLLWVWMTEIKPPCARSRLFMDVSRFTCGACAASAPVKKALWRSCPRPARNAEKEKKKSAFCRRRNWGARWGARPPGKKCHPVAIRAQVVWPSRQGTAIALGAPD